MTRGNRGKRLRCLCEVSDMSYNLRSLHEIPGQMHYHVTLFENFKGTKAMIRGNRGNHFVASVKYQTCHGLHEITLSLYLRISMAPRQ